MSIDIHVIELLPAYTLDCLDEDDTVLVSEHLAVCAVCRAEARSYQAVADQLALAAPVAIPPDRLRRRLMSQIQPSRLRMASHPRFSWWQRLAHLMQRPTPMWGLASLFLILALAVGNVLLWQRLNQPEVMRTVTLTGTAAAPGASGVVVISTGGEYGTLVVDGLLALDEGQQYQLWLIRDGQRTSGAVFSVSQGGYSSVPISSPEPLSNYSAFGVTIEPAGGSSSPTGDKVLAGTL